MKLISALMLIVFLAASVMMLPASRAHADPALPDSTPTVSNKYVFRNVLHTGDFFVLALENTPYATPPATPYSQTYIWQLMNGSTDLGDAIGYDFHTAGYNWNIISFYLPASKAPTWGAIYTLKLTGVPTLFSSPPSYTFTVNSQDYSILTDQTAVQKSIASTIITLAKKLDTKWSLSAADFLEVQGNTGTFLSVQGESFFRGAIFGVQALAPGAFQLVVTAINTNDRTWGTAYIDALAHMYDGTYLQAAIIAGESFFSVTYNLLGLLLVVGMCIVIIFGHWYLSGGNIWKGLLECSGPLVICGRLNIIGLGELGLVAALCWIYFSLKTWRIV